MASYIYSLFMLLAVFHSGYMEQNQCDGDNCGNAESRLVMELFDGMYSPIARPVKDMGTSVNTELGISLINIADLDKDNAVVTLRLWTKAVWTDEFLQWEPTEHGGVETISVPSHMTWNPDFKVFATVGENADEILNVVMSSGVIMSIRPATHKVQCTLKEDDSDDDDDTYSCSLKIGSWTHSKAKLALVTLGFWGPIDVTDFVSHPSCKLTQSGGEIVEKTYEGVPDIYQSLNIDLEIKC